MKLSISWASRIRVILESARNRATANRALRRDILRPAFIRRVCREPDPGGAAVVPPCVLGFLHAYDKARMGQDQGPLQKIC